LIGLQDTTPFFIENLIKELIGMQVLEEPVVVDYLLTLFDNGESVEVDI
jgi:hypothetical protein